MISCQPLNLDQRLTPFMKTFGRSSGQLDVPMTTRGTSCLGQLSHIFQTSEHSDGSRSLTTRGTSSWVRLLHLFCLKFSAVLGSLTCPTARGNLMLGSAIILFQIPPVLASYMSETPIVRSVDWRPNGTMSVLSKQVKTLRNMAAISLQVRGHQVFEGSAGQVHVPDYQVNGAITAHFMNACLIHDCHPPWLTTGMCTMMSTGFAIKPINDKIILTLLLISAVSSRKVSMPQRQNLPDVQFGFFCCETRGLADLPRQSPWKGDHNFHDNY